MGGPLWTRINVVGPWAVSGLNVAGYGWTGPEKFLDRAISTSKTTTHCSVLSSRLSAGFRWWGSLGPGVVGGPMCGLDIESLGRGWPMKSLVFPLIINIYDVIFW